MHIDRPGTTEEVIAPHILQQLRPGEHPAGAAARGPAFREAATSGAAERTPWASTDRAGSTEAGSGSAVSSSSSMADSSCHQRTSNPPPPVSARIQGVTTLS